jgi:hypothetical protein
MNDTNLNPNNGHNNNAVLTTNPIQIDNAINLREWGRTKDVELTFGIKRGTLYNLHADKQIQGKELRARGKLKGVRIWNMDSIRRFIESQSDDLTETKNPNLN